MVAQETAFVLSNADERVVRSYQCTRANRLFAPATLGYLTVTNRRIVYHSSGGSASQQSVLLSEMPVQDASGMSVYMGGSIQWLQFLAFAFALFMASTVLDALLPPFFTSFVFGLLLMAPYGIYRLLDSGLLSQQATEAVRSVLGDVSGDRRSGSSQDVWPRRLRWAFLAGAAVVAWGLVHGSTLGHLWYRTLPVALGLLALVYYWLYITLYGRQSAFSLLISSRTAQGTGIFIPGNAFRLLTSTDRSVMDTLSGTPSVDAPAMAHELGALLTDIRTLGDTGIEKWATVPLPGEPSASVLGTAGVSTQ